MDLDADGTHLWERRHADLRRWRDAHGNCNVPKAEGRLGRWVVRQRELHKKGKLDAPRKAQLDALGFVWNTNEAAWHARYALLRQYADRNGHCCVPISDPDLGMWVAKMRANRRRGKLPPHRVKLLDQLGFVWNTAEADWMDKFEKLLSFREREGHACVPFNEGELGWWVNTQRQSKRKGKLAEHRQRLLDQAGFIWNPQEFLAARRREAATAKAKTPDPAPMLDDQVHSAVDPVPIPVPAVPLSLTESPHQGRKRSADIAFTGQHIIRRCGPDDNHVALKRPKPVPMSPLIQRPLFRLAADSTAAYGAGLSRLMGHHMASPVDELYPDGTPVSHARLSLASTHGSPLAESITSSRADRADVQSIASLLSPAPYGVISQACTVPFGQDLSFAPAAGSTGGSTPGSVPAASELPSFHTGRSTMACVAGSRRGPSPHDFVLPPISSLKVLSNPPNI